MCIYEHTCYGMHVNEGQKKTCGVGSLPAFMKVLGIKLGPSGLAASAFTS